LTKINGQDKRAIIKFITSVKYLTFAIISFILNNIPTSLNKKNRMIKKVRPKTKDQNKNILSLQSVNWTIETYKIREKTIHEHIVKGKIEK
jgi:hypothetical protein